MKTIILFIGMLLIGMLFPGCASSESWDTKYGVPTLSDSAWKVTTDEDTLYILWDQPNETDILKYIFYVSIVDTSLDSISWINNYSETINSWDTGLHNTWESVLTIKLPAGYYMCQMIAIDNNGNRSAPSKPAWLYNKGVVNYLVPKNVRIIIKHKVSN